MDMMAQLLRPLTPSSVGRSGLRHHCPGYRRSGAPVSHRVDPPDHGEDAGPHARWRSMKHRRPADRLARGPAPAHAGQRTLNHPPRDWAAQSVERRRASHAARRLDSGTHPVSEPTVDSKLDVVMPRHTPLAAGSSMVALLSFLLRCSLLDLSAIPLAPAVQCTVVRVPESQSRGLGAHLFMVTPTTGDGQGQRSRLGIAFM
jgi:hypothetical protein